MKQYIYTLIVTSALLFTASCKKEDTNKTTPPPPKVCTKDLSFNAYHSHTEYNKISFTSSSTGSDFATYKWTFGDGNSSTEQSPTYYYSTVGTFAVNLRAITSCGDTVSKDTSIVISSSFTYKFKVDTLSYQVSRSGFSPLVEAGSGSYGTEYSDIYYMQARVVTSDGSLRIGQGYGTGSFDIQFGSQFTTYTLPVTGTYPVSKFASDFYDTTLGFAFAGPNDPGSGGQITVTRSDSVLIANFNITLVNTPDPNAFAQGNARVSRYKYYY